MQVIVLQVIYFGYILSFITNALWCHSCCHYFGWIYTWKYEKCNFVSKNLQGYQGNQNLIFVDIPSPCNLYHKGWIVGWSRKKGVFLDTKLHFENMPYLKEYSIFFDDSFFDWSWGHCTTRKTTIINLIAIINISKFELNLILGLKLRVFRLQWAISFLYAVC